MLAYGGFFFQEYTARQDKGEKNHAAEISVQVNAVSAPQGDRLSAPADSNITETAMIINTEHPGGDIDSDPISSGTAHATRQRAIKQLSPGNVKVENNRGGRVNIQANSQTQRHTYQQPQVAKTSETETYETSETEDYDGLNNLPAVAYAAPSNVDAAPASSLTNTVATSAASYISNGSPNGINTRANGSTNDAQSEKSSGPLSNSNNTGNNTSNSNNNAAEQTWPVPGCPEQLPAGSTEADAELMQQAYGCRYLRYCQPLNDGSGNHDCWWGFYSSTR